MTVSDGWIENVWNLVVFFFFFTVSNVDALNETFNVKPCDLFPSEIGYLLRKM